MSKFKKMWAVEHAHTEDDDHRTFDIFPSLALAQKFITELHSSYRPLYIFVADFNKERIYRDAGSWNYDDFGDLFKNHEVITWFEECGFEP